MALLSIFTNDTLWPQFREEQIAGIFTPTHFIVLAVYFLAIVAALFLSRRMSERGVKRATLIVFAISATLFVAKSIYRALVDDLGGMFPLYLSDLFLFAAPLSLSKFKPLKRTGEAFLAFGSTISGFVYILYPASSFAHYPLWHPISVQGVLFHWGILYVGILNLWKIYRPQARDSIGFFIFITVFMIPGVLLNELLPQYNMAYMYLRGFFAPALGFAELPYLFMLLSYLAQAAGLFWLWFGGCKLAQFLIKRKNT